MSKKLGSWMLTALVVGNMVGSGIFLLPASLAQYGSISLAAWLVTIFGAIAIASIFARLGASMPKLGGPYAYCQEAYGTFVGFQVCYIYWIYTWVGNAAIATSLVGYIGYFFPVIAQNHIYAFATATTAIWLLTLVNLWGIHKAGVLQLVLVILKVLPLAAVTVLGFWYIEPANFHVVNNSGQSNLSAFSSCVVLTMWALTGVESASVPADDVDNPRYTIPLATILGTLIAAVLYITSTIAIMGMIPVEQLSHSHAPFADAANTIFGPIGGAITALAAIFSTVGALNGWILLQSQVPFAAAKDHVFPQFFAKQNRAGTPSNGLILTSFLMTGLLAMNYQRDLVDEFTFIITLATVAILIVYLLTAGAEIILSLRQQDKIPRKTIFRNSLINAGAMAYIYWAIVGSGQTVVYYGFILLFSSVPLYMWMRYAHDEGPNNSATNQS